MSGCVYLDENKRFKSHLLRFLICAWAFTRRGFFFIECHKKTMATKESSFCIHLLTRPTRALLVFKPSRPQGGKLRLYRHVLKSIGVAEGLLLFGTSFAPSHELQIENREALHDLHLTSFEIEARYRTDVVDMNVFVADFQSVLVVVEMISSFFDGHTE